MEVWRARIDEDTACTALPGTSWGLGARDLLPALWAGSWGGLELLPTPWQWEMCWINVRGSHCSSPFIT